MNESLEAIFELPGKTKLVIVVGTVVAIFAVFWFAIYSPLAEEYAALSESIDGPQGLRSRISQKEGIARNLGKFRKEVERLDGELAEALKELPDKREIDQLLSRVSDKARDAGLEIKRFRPQGEQKKDYYAEFPVELEVTGTFHQVATFFDEVGRMERIVNLGQVSMTDPVVTPEKVSLKTSVVATSFRFLEESERPAQQDEQNDKKRRRPKKASEE